MREAQYFNEILCPTRFLLSSKVRPLRKAISSQWSHILVYGYIGRAIWDGEESYMAL